MRLPGTVLCAKAAIPQGQPSLHSITLQNASSESAVKTALVASQRLQWYYSISSRRLPRCSVRVLGDAPRAAPDAAATNL